MTALKDVMLRDTGQGSGRTPQQLWRLSSHLEGGDIPSQWPWLQNVPHLRGRGFHLSSKVWKPGVHVSQVSNPGPWVVALSLTSGNSAVSITIKAPPRRFDLFGSVWACYIKLSWRSFLSVAPAGTSTGMSLNKEGKLNVVGITMSEKNPVPLSTGREKWRIKKKKKRASSSR